MVTGSHLYFSVSSPYSKRIQPSLRPVKFLGVKKTKTVRAPIAILHSVGLASYVLASYGVVGGEYRRRSQLRRVLGRAVAKKPAEVYTRALR